MVVVRGFATGRPTESSMVFAMDKLCSDDSDDTELLRLVLGNGFGGIDSFPFALVLPPVYALFTLAFA